MKHLLFVIFCASSIVCSAQTPQQFMDSILKRTKEISYYANDTNWKKLEKEVKKSVKNADSLDDIIPACEILLNGIRDHHGRLLRNSNYTNFANFNDFENARFHDTREFKREDWPVINDLEARFSYQLLPNNIAYLKVVGVGGQVNGQEESERIRNAVIELADQGAEEWILDLRYNSGGNVNVMLSGLAPLLDSGTVATIKNSDGEHYGKAEIKNGNFWYFEVNAFHLDDKTTIVNPKIAILTSRWTASSGELTAIAFKQQENTLFFGEPTGGYTTNTSWEPIGESLSLVIATGVFCDRLGNPYEENFAPDILFPFEINLPLDEDPCIEQAVNWLIE
jgi:hypothetical protein